jgi:hypothetical protein
MVEEAIRAKRSWGQGRVIAAVLGPIRPIIHLFRVGSVEVAGDDGERLRNRTVVVPSPQQDGFALKVI